MEVKDWPLSLKAAILKGFGFPRTYYLDTGLFDRMRKVLDINKVSRKVEDHGDAFREVQRDGDTRFTL